MGSTVGDALASATSRLAARGDAARVEAEELVSRLLGLTRSGLHLERQRVIDPERWQRLDSWLRRRERGEPIQYVTGRAAFRDLDLAVDPAVLIPRPETEILVETVLDALRRRREWTQPRVLDLGTGSGAIAIAIATEWPAATVTATDASEAALALARANVAAHGARVRLLQGPWFDPLPADERFEVIVSNPPYIAASERDVLPAEVREFEPPEALFSGESGLEALREIVDGAPRHLVAGGVLALELAEMRAQEVAAWLEGAHDWEDARLVDDLTGRPRVLIARRAHGPAIAPAQWGEERRDG